MKRLSSQLRSGLIAAAILAGTCAGVLAGTVDEDWQAVVALDAGPGGQPDTAEAAGNLVVSHLARQEKALRAFLTAHPEDTHVFEAQLRLARLLQIRADFEGSEKLRVDSKRMLDALEKTATPEQLPELKFAKLARMMRSLTRTDPAAREELLTATRRFQTEYPTDRRLAALLTEVATLFDTQPKLKEALLDDARAIATNPDLKARIADDLRRVHLVGQEVPLSFTSVQGQEISIAGLAGRPVFVIFFAQSSPPAMAALGKLQQEVGQLPQGSIRVVGVALDIKRETVMDLLKTRGITWPIAWDGKGWTSPLVRGLGINAVPTVWLLDSHGRLRALNGLDGAANQARQLMREK
ncbi:MAG: TlpA disulfide reductase family protein [Chthoniobacter sp.]|uniref:TlpA family protein disulfide reductase n=1 Tax=Chthoniobacter sp. TaxID=2510640 RepID=UPI0032AE3008